MAAAPPSKPAKVTVWRDGRSRELSVELGEAAQSDEVVASTARGGAAQSSRDRSA